MTINGQPEAGPQRECPTGERFLADLSWSHSMPSLMICRPYLGIFSGERERFPSWIDG
jgi:hypothetical protein